MLTSGGPENRKADHHLQRFAESSYPDDWRKLVAERPPSDDPAALVVRHERDDLVFATVFGELIEAVAESAAPGFSRRPWESCVHAVKGPAWERIRGTRPVLLHSAHRGLGQARDPMADPAG